VLNSDPADEEDGSDYPNDGRQTGFAIEARDCGCSHRSQNKEGGSARSVDPEERADLLGAQLDSLYGRRGQTQVGERYQCHHRGDHGDQAEVLRSEQSG